PPWASRAPPPGPPVRSLLSAASIGVNNTGAPHDRRLRRTIDAMQLTHFGHSCLLADFDDTRVLFDPGTFAHGFEGISGLAAILITHQHPDHVDTARLPELVAANPDAALYADPQTAAQLGAPWQAVHVG